MDMTNTGPRPFRTISNVADLRRLVAEGLAEVLYLEPLEGSPAVDIVVRYEFNIGAGLDTVKRVIAGPRQAREFAPLATMGESSDEERAAAWVAASEGKRRR